MLPPARPAGHQRTPSIAGASGMSRSTTTRSIASTASRAETPPSRPSPSLGLGRAPVPSPVKRTPSMRQPQPPPTPTLHQFASASASRRVASPPPTPRDELPPPQTPVQRHSPIDISSPPRTSDASPAILESPVQEPSVDAKELTALRHEEQELRTRLRLLEAKRSDDQQRIRELEARLADAENFVALRPKLQGAHLSTPGGFWLLLASS